MTPKHKILALSIFAGLLLWVADAVVDAFFFHDTPLLDSLVLAVPTHAICIRLAGMAIIITLGVIVARGSAGPQQSAEAPATSEKQYRALVESVHDGVYQLGTQGRFTFVNDVIVERSGRPRDWFIGRSYLDVIVPEDQQRMQVIFAATMRGESTQPYQTAYRTASGELLHIEVNSSPLFEGDEVVGLLAVSRDITERRQATKALKDSEHELDIRNRIAEIFLTVPDEEVYGDVLQVVLEAMDSKYGVFGYIDEAGAMVVPSMTRHIWDKCQVPDKKIVYPRETWGDSAWPRAIREKRTFYSNEPSTLTPKGHVPITRNIVVPMIHAGDVVGIFHVANKDTDYTQADIRLLETIGGAVAPVLNARLQRDRAQEALHLAVRQWETTFDGVADAVSLLDMQANVLQCNLAMGKLVGERPEECIGRNCCELIHGNPQPLEGCPLQLARSSLRRETVELAVRDRWLQITVEPLKDVKGQFTAVHVVVDITDRKRAEEEIANLAKFPAENPDPVLRVAGDGTITSANKAAHPLLDAWSCQVGQTPPKQWAELAAGVLVSGTREDVEIECGGRIFLTTFAPVVEAGYINLYGRDITIHKEADEAVQRSREELRALAARLQTVREEERTGLARKIHDDVGHILAALKMDLAWVGARLAKASDNLPRGEEITERIEYMSGLVDETIQTIRQTASDLRPGLLDDVGLAAAIEWQAEEFQRRTGIKCTFTNNAEDVELDREQSTALFRICQELLTNVASHAGATAVSITLKRQSDELVLEMSDNGKGIREEQASSSMSLGILGIRERTLLLGGEFSITGQAGKGTTATVIIPLGGAGRNKGD